MGAVLGVHGEGVFVVVSILGVCFGSLWFCVGTSLGGPVLGKVCVGGSILGSLLGVCVWGTFVEVSIGDLCWRSLLVVCVWRSELGASGLC